ncbi:MAG: radical SAM protein [Candidatus Asgardarchaeia archaeon]
MIIPTVKLVKYLGSNRLSRYFLRLGMRRDKDGRKLLEKALEDFAYGRSSNTYSTILSTMIGLLVFVLKTKLKEVRDYFKDTVSRRGLEVVLESIANYGISVPQKLSSPFLVVWNFTNLCNLRCKHCYQNSGRASPDELTIDEKLSLVKELADSGVVAIAFSGGEPLIHRDFWEVAEKANREGLFVAVATNGTMISPAVAKKMVKVGVRYVEVSLDSIDPHKHDQFRGVVGAFDRTVKGIKNLVKEGIFTCIATTVTKLNIDEIPEIIDFAERIGVQRFIAFNFIPTGRGVDIVDLDPSPEERQNLLEYLAKRAKESPIEILSTDPSYARVTLTKERIVSPTHFYVGKTTHGLKVLADFIGGCGAGRMYCAIQPNGDVTPCVFIPNLIVGNVRFESFKEIWENSPILRGFRDRNLLKENCLSCYFRNVCGGCRARAYAYFKDPMAPDPGCIKNREYYDYSFKIFSMRKKMEYSVKKKIIR